MSNFYEIDGAAEQLGDEADADMYEREQQLKRVFELIGEVTDPETRRALYAMMDLLP
jgi:seryl-tRNA(Sec) selenium transferase